MYFKKSSGKNTYFPALFLMFLMFISLQTQLQAQQNDKKNIVSGKWKVKKIEIPSMEQKIASASATDKEKFKAEMLMAAKKSSFEFDKNGNYRIFFNGNYEAGEWKVNDYGSKLFVKKALGNGSLDKEDQIGIEQLSKNTMVLLNDYETGEIVRITLYR